MKIIVITHAPANREVTDRLSGHMAISFVAQKTPEGMLELISAHRESVSVIYFDPAALLFAASERLVWETVRKINELIGKRRDQVILILGLEDGIGGLSGKSLSDRLTREQVNIGMVGKRDSSQIATFIGSVAMQFGPYAEKFGAVFDPPEPPRKMRRGNGHDYVARSMPPPTARSGNSAPAVPTPAEVAREVAPSEAATAESAPIILCPQAAAPETAAPADNVAGTEAPPPAPKAKVPEGKRPDVAELIVDLDLIEKALAAGLHAMFEVLRSGLPEAKNGTEGRAPEIARPTAAPANHAVKGTFTISLVGSVEKEHGDSTRERLILDGKEIILVRRARRMLEALAAHGSCSLSGIFPSATAQAVASFVWETNKKLAKAEVPIMIHASNKENRLHID